MRGVERTVLRDKKKILWDDLVYLCTVIGSSRCFDKGFEEYFWKVLPFSVSTLIVDSVLRNTVLLGKFLI